VSDTTVNDGERPIPEYIAEIAQRLAAFESSLPRELDPVALSRSKLPFKALGYRETLIWRITELGKAALENYNEHRFAAAILLTRAAVETAAALWYLQSKIASAIKADGLGDLDEYLMRLSLGSRNFEKSPVAINVLNFVDQVDKRFAGYRKQYDELSEYSHPNYLGTTCLYSATDFDNYMVSFGANARGSKPAEIIGVMNLSVALMIFDHSYNEVADLMPAFIALCERDLPPAK
jgi:hypothetical protein